MRLAAVSERIHAAGGEVLAVSVDDEIRQAGMADRWPTPMVRYVSDPGGAELLGPLDLFDPDERGGIALPGMLVIAPDGTEVYRYRGRDFADRTTDDDVLSALEALGLEAVEPVDWDGEVEIPEDLRGFFRPSDLGAYFRGNKFGALAIGNRIEDPAARALAKEHRVMSDATLEAWATLRSG